MITKLTNTIELVGVSNRKAKNLRCFNVKCWDAPA